MDEHRRICATCKAIHEQADMLSIVLKTPNWPLGMYALWFCDKHCRAAWLDKDEADA